MPIEWTENLATGIKEIDNQHIELFSRVNKLYDACNKGKGKQEVMKVLGFLEEYMLTHFNNEEVFMSRYAYPEFGPHKIEHDNFRHRIIAFKRELPSEGPELRAVIKLNNLVSDWLVKHIGRMDRTMAEYIKKLI